ncbi:hypothetical protein [Spartinivicinus marinus]|nr:hypothetical protein [Spartinivicinus marinus]
MVLRAFVSFRSVPRILSVLNAQRATPYGWIPHFTSVINWTLRIGLACLNQVTESKEPWVAIMDHSIVIGVKKVLVVLRVPIKVFAKKGQALTLSDCECIGLKVSEKTDADTITQQLVSIFELAGSPAVIVKDQAGNLSKGVSQWKQISGVKSVTTIDDIGHVLANALQEQYKESKPLKQFLEAVRKGASRLRQTELAFLLPPKIRVKGRFQSISKLAKWSTKIECLMRVRGRAAVNSPLEKLRKALPGFTQMKTFIEGFSRTTHIVNEVNKVLKNKGLNQRTYRQYCQLSEALPRGSIVRKRLVRWLKSHLAKQAHLGVKQTPLLVSSDIIESLFGKYKHIIERCPLSDINRMVLIIPALCINGMSQQTMLNAFSQTKHEDLARWEQKNISHSLYSNRRAFLENLYV